MSYRNPYKYKICDVFEKYYKELKVFLWSSEGHVDCYNTYTKLNDEKFFQDFYNNFPQYLYKGDTCVIGLLKYDQYKFELFFSFESHQLDYRIRNGNIIRDTAINGVILDLPIYSKKSNTIYDPTKKLLSVLDENDNIVQLPLDLIYWYIGYNNMILPNRYFGESSYNGIIYDGWLEYTNNGKTFKSIARQNSYMEIKPLDIYGFIVA